MHHERTVMLLGVAAFSCGTELAAVEMYEITYIGRANVLPMRAR